MKLRSFIGLIASIFCLSTSGQQLPMQWLRTFQAQGMASDRIAKITTDNSGNVYVAGYAGRHHGAPDAFAMKRNSQGDTLWTYYYDGGSNNEDYATDIVVDDAGNTYLNGYSHKPSAYLFDCFTVKIDPTGTELWVSRYTEPGGAESFGNALAVDTLGNVYVAGYIDPSSGSNDWLVIKYNSSGIEQWVDVYNGADNGQDEAQGIAIAPNGNPTVCGFVYSNSASGAINAFVKQYTPSNGTAWTDTWSHPSFTGRDQAFGIGFNSSGDAFVGGETMNGSTSNNDAFALRYDVNGQRLWVTIYVDSTTATDEYLTKVIIDDLGNVYFTGTDYRDGYLTKINNDGSNAWRKKWIGPVINGSDVFHGICTDQAGNVYASGRGVYPGEDYYANGGRPNMIISKYNSSGDSMWTYRCADSLNSSMAFAITERNGIIYAGGFVTDTAYVNENLYTLIVDSSGNPINEWIYNGIGDAITMGQFVETDANGNIYCAATIDRLYNLGYDIALIKYDPSGLLLWQRYFSSYGWNNDTLTAMNFDPLGNLVLCLSTDSALLKNNYKVTLLKADQNGNFIDTNTVSLGASALAKSMVIRNDGGIALALSSSSLGGIIAYFDSSLNLLWNEKIDTTIFASTRANSIALFPNGDLALGGFSQSPAAISVGLVQRYSFLGSLIWSTTIDSANVYDEVLDVTVDAVGDLAFTGASGSGSNYAAMVGKVNGSSGIVGWRQIYNPNTSREYGVKVRFSPAGNVVCISRGWTGSVARYYTIQYSGSGILQWANVYSQTASDREPVDLLVEANNRVVTAGWEINSFSLNYDYVLAAYSSSGAVEFVNTYTGSAPVASTWDQLHDLTSDNNGNFIVTGQSSREFYNNFLYKMLTIKYGGVVVGNSEIDRGHKQFAIAFPNPSAEGKFTIFNTAARPFASGLVYDVFGKLCSTMNLESGIVKLTNAPSGIYMLVLERNDLPVECIRLIIQ